jgi:SOS-response transcriptional repressor LexA
MNKNQEKIIELAKQKDISKMGFREIGRELGIENPQTVIYHLGKLNEKGLLYYDTKNRQRVARPKAFVTDKFFNIPVVASGANCGPAVELAQDVIEGYLKISQKLLHRPRPDGLMVVRAIGNSLNMANLNSDSIEDGDYVIVDTKKQPDNGLYVLSIINNAANFKKFFKDENKKEIRLLSESTENIPPIVLHEEELEELGYSVNGVAIKVIKNK